MWERHLAVNVSAVYEPPEPTARAAQEVPRLSQATPFIGCVAGARKRAVRNTQRVMCSGLRGSHAKQHFTRQFGASPTTQVVQCAEGWIANQP
jgi:hypothetical protein